MPSSISHSDSEPVAKGSMGALLGALALSYLLAVGYTLWINPEVRFWTAAYEKKAAWAGDLTKAGKRKLVFVGGSSCAFQIDAGALTTQHGIPSVNMGLAAGMGSRALTAAGLKVISPGDILVVAIEPGLLLDKPDVTPLGYQILTALGILFHPGDARIAIGKPHLGELLSAMRPGLPHVVTMVGKVLYGMELYRYRIEDVLPGGGVFTSQIASHDPFKVVDLIPDSSTMKWLQEVNAWCRRRNISVYYLIPRQFYRKAEEAAARRENESFLQRLSKAIPLTHELTLGVLTDESLFADSSLHLTKRGMDKRTVELAGPLKEIWGAPDRQFLPAHR